MSNIEFLVNQTFGNQSKWRAYIKHYLHSIVVVGVTFILVSACLTVLFLLNPDNFELQHILNIINVSSAGILFTLWVLGLPTENEGSILSDTKELKNKQLFQGLEESKINTLIERSFDTIKSIDFYWRSTIFIVFLFYLYKTAQFFLELYDKDTFSSIFNPHYSSVILDFTNIASSLTFFLLYVHLAYSTYDTAKKKVLLFSWKTRLVIGIAFLIFFADLIIKCVPNDEIIVGRLIISLFIGLFSAIIISLFAGRIDSKFMRIRSRWVGLLYLYAFVMLLVPLISIHFNMNAVEIKLQENKSVSAETIESTRMRNLSQSINYSKNIFVNKETINNESNAHSLDTLGGIINKKVKIYLFLLAFILKIYLALLLIWLFRSGLILFYVIRMNHIRKIIEEEDRVIYNTFKQLKGVPKLSELFTFKENKNNP